MIFRTPLNMRTVTIKLARTKVVDLMMVCLLVASSDGAGQKWADLHDELKEALDAFDEKVKEEYVDV